MSLIRQISAGGNKITTQCQGGGDKKQGLTPNATGFMLGQPFYWRACFGGLTGKGNGRANGTVDYNLRTFYISTTNQLGGIGRERSQFNPSADGVNLLLLENRIFSCQGLKNKNIALGSFNNRIKLVNNFDSNSGLGDEFSSGFGSGFDPGGGGGQQPKPEPPNIELGSKLIFPTFNNISIPTSSVNQQMDSGLRWPLGWLQTLIENKYEKFGIYSSWIVNNGLSLDQIIYQYIDSDNNINSIQTIIDYIYIDSVPSGDTENWSWFAKDETNQTVFFGLSSDKSNEKFKEDINYIIFNYPSSLSESLLIIDVGKKEKSVQGANINLTKLNSEGSLYNQAILGSPNGWLNYINREALENQIQWPKIDLTNLAEKLIKNTTEMEFCKLNGDIFTPFNNNDIITEAALCFQNWGLAVDGNNPFVYYTPSFYMPPGGNDPLTINIDRDFDYNITTTYFKIYEKDSTILFNFIKNNIINSKYPLKIFNYFYTDEDEQQDEKVEEAKLLMITTIANSDLTIVGSKKDKQDETGPGYTFIRAETTMTFWLGFLGEDADDPSKAELYLRRAEGELRLDQILQEVTATSEPGSDFPYKEYKLNKNRTCIQVVEAIQGWVNGEIIGITNRKSTTIRNIRISGGIPRGQSPIQINGYNAYYANQDPVELGPVRMDNVNILNNWLAQTDGPDIISPNTTITNCLIQSADDTLKLQSNDTGNYTNNVCISGGAGAPIAVGGYGNSGNVKNINCRRNSIIRLTHEKENPGGTEYQRAIFNFINNTCTSHFYDNISILDTYCPQVGGILQGNSPNRILSLGYLNAFSGCTNGKTPADFFRKILINRTYCYAPALNNDLIFNETNSMITFENLKFDYTSNFIQGGDDKFFPSRWYMPYSGTAGFGPVGLKGEPPLWNGDLILGKNPNNFTQPIGTEDNKAINIDVKGNNITPPTFSQFQYTQRSVLPFKPSNS